MPVYFPAFQFAGTKLYCLVTEAVGCEQVAWGCYAAASRPGLEPATTRSQVWHPTTKPPRHLWLLDYISSSDGDKDVSMSTYAVCLNGTVTWPTEWERHIFSVYWTSSWQITFVTLFRASVTSCSHSCWPWRRRSRNTRTFDLMTRPARQKPWCSQ